MEARIEKMGEDFTRKIQPMETDAMAFDPNARVGVIRGMAREEYRVPKQNQEDGADGATDVDASANVAANQGG
jgi:hypothetical protein